MTYNIRKNWGTTFELIAKNPIVLLPFIILAFLEALALEILYYFPRRPLLYIFGPPIRRFFGEPFLHYPGNLVILPQLFYYAQVVIYIFFGVLLTAICVNIFKHIKTGAPLRKKTVLDHILKRCGAFLTFAVFMVVSIYLLQKLDELIFFKALGAASNVLPHGALKFAPFLFSIVLFLSNAVLQVFLVLTVPLLVIKEKNLLAGLGRSITLGARNFLTIFWIILVPLLVYLPVTLLKTDTARLIERTFPEINLIVIIIGIIVAIFVESFIALCAAQFVMDKA